MKQIEKVSAKGYCCHVNVIEYALYAGKGKAVVKKTYEISKIVGVSKRTLQFYDDEGMIRVERSENNYRLYDERTLKDLWEIMLYKEMGMKLKEIKKILLMSEHEKKEFYEKYVKKIRNQIQELEEREKFISLIMVKGLPPMPEESIGVTYKSKIDELRKGVGLEEKHSRILQMRYLLDEAYQQMQQGQFRYAICDAGSVMREAVKMILQHENGYVSDDLLMNIKTCERRKLLGDDEEFVSKLYEVYHICNNNNRNLNKEKCLSYRKVHFAIMQLKDLLNFAEREAVCS